MNSNYELSYWARKAEEELAKPRMSGLKYGGFGRVSNNRKRTDGRKIQVINLKTGGTKQIRTNI